MAKKYNYIQQAVDCITNLDDFHPKEIIGCTEDEINNLEKLLGEHYYIPEAYVEFLEWGGHGIVEMLSRANFYYSKIYQYKKDNLLKHLRKNGDFKNPRFRYDISIKDRTTVFYYDVSIIRVMDWFNGIEDPNVLYYNFDTPIPKTVFLSEQLTFSEYLLEECERYKSSYTEVVLKSPIALQKKVKVYKNAVWSLVERIEKELPLSKENISIKNQYIQMAKSVYYFYSLAKLNTRFFYEHSYSEGILKHNPISEAKEIAKQMDELAKMGADLLDYTQKK